MCAMEKSDLTEVAEQRANKAASPLLRSLRGMQGLFELPERVAAGMKCA
jgi:hypothetical protein